MGKYKINDFKIGDQVYHLSNSKLIMVVISVNQEINVISCRWIDGQGQVLVVEFLPEELGKIDDLRTRISRVSSIP